MIRCSTPSNAIAARLEKQRESTSVPAYAATLASTAIRNTRKPRRSPIPASQPAMGGDLGISGEWPIAPSSTTSQVAATSTSAHAPASTGAHCQERVLKRSTSLRAATLTRPRGSQCGPDCLRFQVRAEALVAVLATQARGLETAERRRGIAGGPRVHVHRPRAQHRGELVGAAHVAGPDARGEAVLGVVGAASDLLERLVATRHKHRAEDLLARDLQLVVVGGEHGRRHEVAAAVLQRLLAADEQLGALLGAGLDVADDALQLLGGHEWPELRLGVQPGSEPRDLRLLD